MAPPKKEVKKTGVPKMVNPPPPKQNDLTEIVKTEVVKQSPEQFLISKGINPPIKDAPLNNVFTFNQLCELMNEFKG